MTLDIFISCVITALAMYWSYDVGHAVGLCKGLRATIEQMEYEEAELLRMAKEMEIKQ